MFIQTLPKKKGKKRVKMRLNLKKLVREAAEKLSAFDDCDTLAEEMAKFAFSLTKTQLLLNPEKDVLDTELNIFQDGIKKLETGYPLQYITNQWDFFGSTFFVTEGVLIPRCETEQIVDRCISYINEKKIESPVIFDICTGTGCIGLSVAKNIKNASVYLFDISEAALYCANENKKRLCLDNVTILDYDIFSGFNNSLPRPDVILCNPPYVTGEEYEELEKNIFYEPKNAIVADGDGLDFYRCLADKWLPHLKDNGFFMVEGSEWQASYIKDIFKEKGIDSKSQCDIFGFERFVLSP